jgi:hypothetical protein
MDRIPRIFVINLPHRVDRLESIKKELDRMGFLDKMEIVEGVVIQVGSSGAAGIAEAQARCIELARDRGYEMIMILQDDCKFLVSKDTFNNEIETFLNTAPADWNGMWFGSFWNNGSHDNPDTNWIIPDDFVQDTGTLIHSRYYSELMNLYRFCRDKYIETGEDCYNIDAWMSRNKIPIYALKTKLCGQATCYSDRTFLVMKGGCSTLL